MTATQSSEHLDPFLSLYFTEIEEASDRALDLRDAVHALEMGFRLGYAQEECQAFIDLPLGYAGVYDIFYEIVCPVFEIEYRLGHPFVSLGKK